MELVVGAGRLDRRVSGADELLIAYREDSGSEYLDHRPNAPADVLVAEDLAVTTLINSRFGMAAFRSLARQGGEIDLAVLPEVPLEKTCTEEREQVARLVATVAGWPGFAASTATKVLHKKRPRLIPILDNQAIFGAYMNPRWPKAPSLTDSVKAQARIAEALDWIAFDLTRHENARVWPALEEREPSRSRIQLFDSVWWMHFRGVEPVERREPRQTETRRTSERATERLSGPHGSGDAVLVFADNDDGYLAWLDAHPVGFVLNSFRNPKPTYLKLHRASCGRIRGVPPRGGAWTSPYIKICSGQRAEIEAWAVDAAHGAVSPCKWCFAEGLGE